MALAVAVFLEVMPWHKTHEEKEKIFISVTIFFFYFICNWMYWLFGFKYWVISIEIP